MSDENADVDADPGVERVQALLDAVPADRTEIYPEPPVEEWGGGPRDSLLGPRLARDECAGCGTERRALDGDADLVETFTADHGVVWLCPACRPLASPDHRGRPRLRYVWERQENSRPGDR